MEITETIRPSFFSIVGHSDAHQALSASTSLLAISMSSLRHIVCGTISAGIIRNLQVPSSDQGVVRQGMRLCTEARGRHHSHLSRSRLQATWRLQ